MTTQSARIWLYIDVKPAVSGKLPSLDFDCVQVKFYLIFAPSASMAQALLHKSGCSSTMRCFLTALRTEELGGIMVGGDFLDAECKVLLYVQDLTHTPLPNPHGKAIGRQTAAWSKRAAYQWL